MAGHFGWGYMSFLGLLKQSTTISGLNNRNLLPCGADGWESKVHVSAELGHLRSVRERVSQASLPAPGGCWQSLVFLTCRSVTQISPEDAYLAFSLCTYLSLCLNLSFS